MRPVPRIVLVAAAALWALPACFSPVSPPGGEADAGPGPRGDGGGVECVKDSDCPAPPSTLCAPAAAFCDRGTCSTRSLPTVWEKDPGACEIKEHCACQSLGGPDCIGGWACTAGRCNFDCSQPGCQSDLECPSGQNCFADCQGAKACQAGCHDSTDCPAGKVCYLPMPKCGEPVGTCQDAPSCTSDDQCPAGSVCEFSDYGGTQRSCLAGCHQDAQCGDGQVCAILLCANCPNCPCYGQCQAKAGCEFDTECAAGMVCGTESGRCDLHCLEGCRTDKDCRPDQGCAPPPPCMGCGCDHGTCYTKPKGCTSDSECAAGQVCAPLNDPTGCTGERQCVSGCFVDKDCGADQVCMRGYCGACCPGNCVKVQTACKTDAECQPGEICEGCGETGPKSCMRGCRDSYGCQAGESCEQVLCDTCPCPAQCYPTKPGCQSDAACGSGTVCEPGPGCTGPNQCVAGCHEDSQCPNGGTCAWMLDCLTCPCPGQCSTPACLYDQAFCSTGLECIWGSESCWGGCCQTCPVPPPSTCLSNQCPNPGGRDTNGCDTGPVCGACCKCSPGTPVCGENYGTYGSECEATCAGVKVLHAGACLPYEGLGCDWNGGGCSQGQYCRDPCPMCGSVQQLRCTQMGACVWDWDCPGGLGSPTCADGTPPTWTCANHSCLASCPP
ncbi:MAG TPA: hypothetical protein VGK67_25560 [Myxococcales bacterium]|jgi:Cys-rich repeat protein